MSKLIKSIGLCVMLIACIAFVTLMFLGWLAKVLIPIAIFTAIIYICIHIFR